MSKNIYFGCEETIPCPECKKKFKGKRYLGPKLEVVEHNYHGTGIDVGECPECGKDWGVYYKVSKLERWPDWDGLSREEREKEEQEELVREAEEMEAKAKIMRATAVAKKWKKGDRVRLVRDIRIPENGQGDKSFIQKKGTEGVLLRDGVYEEIVGVRFDGWGEGTLARVSVVDVERV